MVLVLGSCWGGCVEGVGDEGVLRGWVWDWNYIEEDLEVDLSTLLH